MNRKLAPQMEVEVDGRSWWSRVLSNFWEVVLIRMVVWYNEVDVNDKNVSLCMERDVYTRVIVTTVPCGRKPVM